MAMIIIGAQRNNRKGTERNEAVKPARRAPIPTPMSNIVIKNASARGLSFEETLSLSIAAAGATRIPHPTPYTAINIAREVKLGA